MAVGIAAGQVLTADSGGTPSPIKHPAGMLQRVLLVAAVQLVMGPANALPNPMQILPLHLAGSIYQL